MASKEELQALLERVEAATGPDRELEANIRRVLFAPPTAYVERSKFNGAWCIFNGVDRQSRPRLFECPHGIDNEVWRGEYTASIDAALAVVGCVLPETFVEMSGPRKYLNIPTPVPNRWRVELTPGAMAGWAGTLPLAILAAALRALISQTEAA